MKNEELSETLLLVAQQTAAVADVLALICRELSVQDQRAASRIATTLEQISDDPNLGPTLAFQQFAPWFAQHLRANQNQPFLSFQPLDSNESGLSELQKLLQKLKK